MPEAGALSIGEWRLWEQFALRGPGFPVGGLGCLVPEGVAAGADKFVVGEVLSGPGWDAFVELFGQGAVATARGLQVVASSSGFRAAVGWQNRAVLESGVRPFLGWVPSVRGRTSMPRQREELVAHYWQRFCVKNDTIGFFGPVGWGRWDLSGSAGLVVEPGEGLVAEAGVYFASWAVDALARVLDEDPGLRVWVAPRRVPYVRVTDAGVVVPGRGVQPVGGLARWVLQRCDGVMSVVDLAVAASQVAGRRVGVDEVVAVVGELVGRRWVRWRLEVPACTYPERRLREVLQRVGDPVVRGRVLAPLDRLERARAVVAECWDDADLLNAALAELEAVFAAVTSSAASRGKGVRTAPCRSLVYLDTRRSATATAGTTILNELGPLGLCLTAARWMMNRFAAVTLGRIRQAYERIRARQGTVDLATLWFECLPAPHGRSVEDIDAIQAEMREKWARILDMHSGARRITLRMADIADRVEEEFGEPGRGWSLSRYVSPDIMVVASDLAAVARGEFQLVLGELHLAMNTVGASLFVKQHPDERELLAETTIDFPEPRLLPMLPKEIALKWSTRSRPALVRPEDYFVALVDDTADPHRQRTVRSADVIVTEHDGQLVVGLGDGARFDLLDVFAHALSNRVMNRFDLRSGADHSPRVTVDKMVIARETWRFDPADITFAAEKNEARRYVQARWWRATHELPRHIFVTSVTEPRPFHVDFDSPVSVNILAKAIRRLARTDAGQKITVTEMLPTPEHAWLTDDHDNAYTAELRLVAVDQRPVEVDRSHLEGNRR